MKADRILKICEALFFLALAYAAISVPHRIDSAIQAMRTDTAREAATTRAAIGGVLQPIATAAAAVPGSLTKIVDDRSREAVAIVGSKTDIALGIVGRVADHTTAAVENVAKVREDLRPALAEIGPTLATLRSGIGELGPTLAAARPGLINTSLMASDVRAALAPMLDCHGNAACLPSQTYGILGGTKTLLGEGALTARTWRKETPAIAGNIAALTGNAEKLSRPHWYLTAAKIAAPIAAGVILGKVSK